MTWCAEIAILWGMGRLWGMEILALNTSMASPSAGFRTKPGADRRAVPAAGGNPPPLLRGLPLSPKCGGLTHAAHVLLYPG